MSMTQEEMATEITKVWLAERKGQHSSTIVKEIKEVYISTLKAIVEASDEVFGK